MDGGAKVGLECGFKSSDGRGKYYRRKGCTVEHMDDPKATSVCVFGRLAVDVDIEVVLIQKNQCDDISQRTDPHTTYSSPRPSCMGIPYSCSVSQEEYGADDDVETSTDDGCYWSGLVILLSPAVRR